MTHHSGAIVAEYRPSPRPVIAVWRSKGVSTGRGAYAPPVPSEQFTLTTADGLALEAERSAATGAARAGMVLCHPHPRFGGTMRSLVISALFGALPDAGIDCLRFNFRGVEGSEGDHEDGDGERTDVVAAIDTLAAALAPGTPLVLAGWSFGADMALSVPDARVAAWLAIACPLRSARDPDVVGRDPRPKLLVLAEHDEIRSPEEIRAAVAGWTNSSIEVIRGASHFFVGATDKLVALTGDYVGRVVAA
jgi:alpha/beta superfamily hydrolase